MGVTKEADKSLIDSAGKLALDAAIKIVQEKILALILLNGANYNQYGEVHNMLSN